VAGLTERSLGRQTILWLRNLKQQRRRGQGAMPPKFKHIWSFCALRSGVPNKNTVVRLKSSILAPHKFFPRNNFRLATPLNDTCVDCFANDRIGFFYCLVQKADLWNSKFHVNIFQQSYRWWHWLDFLRKDRNICSRNVAMSDVQSSKIVQTFAKLLHSLTTQWISIKNECFHLQDINNILINMFSH